MEKSLGSLRMEDKNIYVVEHAHDSFRCDGCRSEFHKPLLATVSSHGRVQIYYACPRCLTKVDDVEEHRSRENREDSFSVEPIKKAGGAKAEVEVRCHHFVGYLKKRAKDAPIPDECLTCNRMIECMVR